MEDTPITAANADPAKAIPTWQKRHTRLLEDIDNLRNTTPSEQRFERLTKLATVLRNIESIIQGLSPKDAAHYISRLTALQQNCINAVHHESHDDSHLDHVIHHASAFMRSISQGAKEEMANDGDGAVNENSADSAVILRKKRLIHTDRIPTRTNQDGNARRNSGYRAGRTIIETAGAYHEGTIVPLIREKQ